MTKKENTNKSPTTTNNKKILRVGFDLDGVLLYNPARITRPIIAFIKKNIFSKKTNNFYLPKSKIEKWCWHIFHKSSLFISPGLNNIKELVKKEKIEAYIITARYSFLKDDFENWLKKIEANKYFKGCYYNKKNEQPHIFKEKMIKKLNLDIFVEDNWDIVRYLNPKFKNEKLKVNIFWVYNIFDKKIKYKYKFPSLTSIFKNFIDKRK